MIWSDVAQDGGATRGDAAFGNEGQEPREKVVNVDRGVEFGKFGEKFGGEAFRVIVGMLRGAGVAEISQGGFSKFLSDWRAGVRARR